MGKLKTKKGVLKRFKISKKGKVRYAKGGKGHLLTNKNSSRLRSLRKKAKLEGGANWTKYVKRMLPYG